MESTYFGSRITIPFLIDRLKECENLDQNIILSYHFYEPSYLTTYQQINNSIEFPGYVPVYKKNIFLEKIYWDRDSIKKILNESIEHAHKNGFKVFVGEFGISRVVRG